MADPSQNTNPGSCDYNQLARAMRYNPDCSKEIYHYCIDVAYKVQTGISSSSAQTEGTAVCSMILGFSTLSDKVAVPITRSFWKIITNNIWESMLVITFIIIIFAVAGNAKRRR
jgi:hypothetical protein